MKNIQNKFILIIALFIIPNVSLHAATEITSDITTNTTWNSKGSPYIISNNIQIDAGKKLTINSGVIVQFDPGTYIDVFGTVSADNKSGGKIYFTSSADTSLTRNKDRRGGLPAVVPPAAGDYVGFIFNPGSTGRFDSVEMRYAQSAIQASEANLSVSDSDFENNTGAIQATGGSLNLVDNEFSNNEQPLLVDFSTSFSHRSNKFISNVSNGIGLTGDYYNGDYTLTSGDGQYILYSNINVFAGKTLVLQPGITVKTANNNTISLIGGSLLSSAFNNRSHDDECDEDDRLGNTVLDGVSIQAFNNAKITMSDVTIKNISGTALSIWSGSTLIGNNIVIDTVAGGINSFSDSSISLKNSAIRNFGTNSTAITLFNNTALTIQNTTIDTGGDGIVAFNSSSVTGDRLVVKNITGGGIISFGNDGIPDTKIKLRNSELTKNGFGMYLINHTEIDAINNAIYANDIGVMTNTGSSYVLAQNWWGSKTGPFSATTNATGTGNEVYDGIIFKPWLTRNPLSSNSSDDRDNHGHERKDRYTDNEKKGIENKIRDRIDKIKREYSRR